MIDGNQINSLMFADSQRSSQLTELQQRWQQLLPVIIGHLRHAVGASQGISRLYTDSLDLFH